MSENLLLVLHIFLGIDDAHPEAPNIHRGIGVIAAYGLQVAIPLKNKARKYGSIMYTYN